MRKGRRKGTLLAIGLCVSGAILAEPAAAARRTALLHVGLRILPHEAAIPSPATSPAAAKRTAEGTLRVVIREGDTLSSLARQYYGTPSAYQMIIDANRDTIRNPDRILPGTLLILPQVAHDPAH